LIRENELIIVDGTQGVVIVDPDRRCSPSTSCGSTNSTWSGRNCGGCAHPRAHPRRRRRRAACQHRAAGRRGAGADNGATGIGLFRSEFLFLNRTDLPDEDEQFEAYRSVGGEMDGPAGDDTHLRSRRRQADRRHARIR
jgi:phosphoenolpyruvate-protein phosphotransferase (PTS system enzyme I)